MDFETPLIKGTLIKRYKRFLADVELEDGSMVTAHCPNSGSMLSVREPGAAVWLSPASNPNRKLKFTWELIEINGALVGINTHRPNALVSEAIAAGRVKELADYRQLRREVKYGKNSRIDILLEDDHKPPCYVEIKNVTMRRNGEGPAEFPDAVTARGTKHMAELADMVREGNRAVIFYLVQRTDCEEMGLAADIDPGYAEAVNTAREIGVEVLGYNCHITPQAIQVTEPLPVRL